jgi:hypothetical protein
VLELIAKESRKMGIIFLQKKETTWPPCVLSTLTA